MGYFRAFFLMAVLFAQTLFSCWLTLCFFKVDPICSIGWMLLAPFAMLVLLERLNALL